MKRVSLRGVEFTPATREVMLDALLSALGGSGLSAVYTPNSEIVQTCIENPFLYGVINSAEFILPDGIGVIKAAKLLGLPITERLPGVEMGEAVLSRIDGSVGVYILGGKPGVAVTAAANLKEKYPALSVVGTHDGYFNKTGEESLAVVDEINASGARLLLVCLGAPAQEIWIHDNRYKLTTVKLAMALGGSVDVYAGTVKRAPDIFCRLGLEWLYRLLREPKRIGRMMSLPKFYFGTVWYKIRGKK